MQKESRARLLAKVSKLNFRQEYWRAIIDKADQLGSDGCTGVSEWHHLCCLEHDIHYRTHRRIRLRMDIINGEDVWYVVEGAPLIRKEADKKFLVCMQAPGGFWNNMRARFRYYGVRLLGNDGWEQNRRDDELVQNDA